MLNWRFVRLSFNYIYAGKQFLKTSRVMESHNFNASSTKRKKIHFFGDIFFDIIANNVKKLPIWGGDTLASSVELKPGGSCLNTIVHASDYAKYGLHLDESLIDLHIFSAIGSNDKQGELCYNYLNEHIPFQNNRCVKIDGFSTPSCIVISGSNDRCFISDRGCIAQLLLNWFQYDELVKCSHFHITGYYNCSKIVSNNEDLQKLLHLFKINNITTSLNTQYDATGQWDHVKELCSHLTFFFCNEDELFLICNRYMNNSAQKTPSMDTDDHSDTNTEPRDCSLMAKIILNWGCQYVVVTHGARGVTGYYYLSDSNTNNNSECQTSGTSTSPSSTTNNPGHNNVLMSIHQNAAHSISVADSTGAGDAFIGAFLVAWNHPSEPWSVRNVSVGDGTINENQSSTLALESSNSHNNSTQQNRFQYALFHGCVSGGSAVTLVGGSTVASSSSHYQDIANNHMK